jgi:diguanylate cyclase
VVSVLAFIVSSVFLLYLIPEKKIQDAVVGTDSYPIAIPQASTVAKAIAVSMVPLESDGTTRLFQVGDIHSIHATTHYSLVFDGQREHFSPWSITEMADKLDQDMFMRVHRSHLVAVAKVRALRKSGDGAVVEVGTSAPRIVPVSRTQYAELKSRLGLQSRLREHSQKQKVS